MASWARHCRRMRSRPCFCLPSQAATPQFPMPFWTSLMRHRRLRGVVGIVVRTDKVPTALRAHPLQRWKRHGPATPGYRAWQANRDCRRGRALLGGGGSYRSPFTLMVRRPPAGGAAARRSWARVRRRVHGMLALPSPQKWNSLRRNPDASRRKSSRQGFRGPLRSPGSSRPGKRHRPAGITCLRLPRLRQPRAPSLSARTTAPVGRRWTRGSHDAAWFRRPWTPCRAWRLRSRRPP